MRPDGRLQIDSTHMASKDVLVAKLSGAYSGTVAAVRVGKKYYLTAPKKLGGTRVVPADSLTDCLNYEIGEIGKELGKKSKSSKKGRVQECGQ